MDARMKKVTRKRKAPDDSEIETDTGKKNANINDNNITKVTNSRRIKSTSKVKKNSSADDMGCVHTVKTADNNTSEMWSEAEVLSQRANVSQEVAKNFIALLTEGCTLPFIARYRKAAVNQMMPDR